MESDVVSAAIAAVAVVAAAYATLRLRANRRQLRRLQEGLDSASHQRFSALFDASPVAFSLLEPQSYRLIDVNPAFESLTGYSRADVIGRPLVRLGLWSETPELNKMREAFEASGHLDQFRLHIRHKDGSPLTCLHSVETIVLDGEPVALGISTDITEQMQAEAALRRSEAKYAVAFHASPTPMAISTIADGRIVDVNKAYLRLFGYQRDELLGRTAEERSVWKNPEQRAATMKALKAMDGSAHGIEITLQAKDGRDVVCLGSAQVIELDDTPCYLSALQDISAIRDAQTERQRLEEQMRQSQKLEAIGTLVGGIAHDFNNILTVTIGATDLAAEALDEGSPAREFLLQAQEGNIRARDLVRQIVTFSRQGESRRDEFDLRDSLHDAAAFLRASLPPSIEIHCQVSDEPARFLGDATQLHQVLMNLCTNAAHAMDFRGRISVTLDREKVGTVRQTFSGPLRAGSYYRLGVRDTGRGIASEDLDRIFDPFFTSKAAGEGTGLGLSVVHGIVMKHGGGIEVTSEPGHGTQFDVFLPVPPAGAKAPPVSRSDSVNGGTCNLVIVDDESKLLALQAAVLEWRGHRVKPFSDSRLALAFIEERLHDVDVLITDLMMPELSGVELIDRVAQLRQDLPVIVVTGGSLSRQWDQQEMPSQVVEILHKPFSPNELAECVGRVLSHTSQSSRQVT